MQIDVHLLLFFILILPVYAWKPLRLTVIPVGFSFLVYYWRFGALLQGSQVFLFHDTHSSISNLTQLVSQWLDQGVSLGWNPYAGGGHPMALYNNLTFHTPIYMIQLFTRWLGYPLDHYTLFMTAYLFSFCWAALGCLFFFYLWTSSRTAAFLGFGAFLFSGITYVEVGQYPFINTLFYLPWVCFWLLKLIQQPTRSSLWVFGLLLGVCTNYYIPLYLGFVLLAALALPLGGLVTQATKAPLFCFLRQHPASLLAALGFVVIGALPMFEAKVQMQDYVSPTRGWSQGGTVSSSQTGSQPNVAVSVKCLGTFLTPSPVGCSFIESYHAGFYLGAPVLLLAFLALGAGRRGVWLLAGCLLVALLANGTSPIWGWLVDYLPGGSMLRHSFLFGRGLGWMILLCAMEGFGLLFSKKTNLLFVFAALLTSIMLIQFVWIELVRSEYRAEWLSLWGSGIALMLAAWAHRVSAPARFVLVLLPAVIIGHLIYTGPVAPPRPEGKFVTQEFAYPDRWKLYNHNFRQLPFDVTALFNKEILWLHPADNFNYLIQKDFAVLLKGLFDNKHILQAEGQIFHLVGQRPLVGFNPWDYIEAVKLSIPVKTEQTNLPAGDSPKRMQCQSGNLAQERLELPFAAAANDKIKRKRFGSSFNGPTWIQELVMVIPIQEKQELAFSVTDECGNNLIAGIVVDTSVSGTFRFTFKQPRLAAKLAVEVTSQREINLQEFRVEAVPQAAVETGVLMQPLPSQNPNRKELHFELDQPNYLLRMENDHPGWVATLGGKQVSIDRLDYNLQGVALPAGKYNLVFEYKSLYYGKFVLAQSLVIFMYLFLGLLLHKDRTLPASKVSQEEIAADHNEG